MRSILGNAVVNAGLTALYVGLVGNFLFFAGQMQLGRTKTPLVPVAMLLLLVFSAALVGALIFGRPMLWYLQGRAKEALLLLAATMTVLFVLTLAAFLTLLALR